MATEYKNIYQKLHVIQQRINGLGKDKQAFGYKYVTGDKVLDAIKPIMNEVGLLLKQEVLSIENTRQDYATKSGQTSEINSKVMMRFTWVDTATGEKDENLFGANGQNAWDKGVGSALTYGERYFLLKYFHIATDEDDIDNPERKLEETANKAPQQTQEQKQPATPTQQESAIKAMDDVQKDKVEDLLKSPLISASLKKNVTDNYQNWTYSDADSAILSLSKTIESNGSKPITDEHKAKLVELLEKMNHEPRVVTAQKDRIGKLQTVKHYFDLKKEYESIVNKLQAA